MSICADCARLEHHRCAEGAWDDSGNPTICGCWADGHKETQ